MLHELTNEQRTMMQKTFTDAYIRKLNELCEMKEHCDKSCDGIGWCKDVFNSMYIPKPIQAEVRNHERTR